MKQEKVNRTVKQKPTTLGDAGQETAAVNTDHAELASVHETLGFGRGTPSKRLLPTADRLCCSDNIMFQ
ncbi:MAG TPA: hypothetical protein VIH89_06610 [Candidatus Sulfotelmatobacter sp.]